MRRGECIVVDTPSVPNADMVIIRFGPFFLEPVVAGLPTPTSLEPHPKPYISTMDTYVDWHYMKSLYSLCGLIALVA